MSMVDNKYIRFFLFFSIFLLLSILFIDSAYAYNSKAVPNLTLIETSHYYYGWTGSTTHSSAIVMPIHVSSENIGLDSQVAYRYRSFGTTTYNDSNGFSIMFTSGTNFSTNTNYNLSFLLCSSNGSLPVSGINIGTNTNVGAVETTSYGTINSWDYVTISNVDDGIGGTFRDCKLIVANFLPKYSGSMISLRYRSSSTSNMGTQINFLGYGIDTNGLDYTSYFNSLNSSVSNLQSSLDNSTRQILDSQSDINDNLTSDSVDSPDNAFSSFTNMLPSNGVITDLITLPVSLFQKVLNSINGSCTSYNLGSIFNKDIILPCIDIADYIGSTLFNVIDVLISGIFVFSISKKMIHVFENFTSMKDGDIIG